MSDWLGLGFVVLVLVIAIIAISMAGKPSKEISAEEFERRVRENPGLINAGMIGLQKILEPGAKKAIEVQEEMKRGVFDGEQGSGDTNDTTTADQEVEANSEESKQ
jgi:hypothetical protein